VSGDLLRYQCRDATTYSAQHIQPNAIAPTTEIAATAELAGLTALHLDKHFELVAELTGQHTERLRP
jgi:hypothetical protein